MINSWVGFTCILLGWFTPVTAQTNNAEPLPAALRQLAAATLQEKIYLHTDKNFYLAGETIWFKIYCVEGAQHKLTDVSRIAYAEVLDRQNKPVLQIKTGLDKGIGSGSFALPVSLNTGMYTLRAYTSWMKNFGAAGFFEKAITIVNSLKRMEGPQKDTPAYRIDFFPEGGNLVNGLQSRVAFQVLDPAGNGTSCEGTVLNETNDTVARFRPYKFGMGSFLFTPGSGHRYKATVTFTGGKSIYTQLPQALENGYVMQLAAASDSVLALHVHAKDAGAGGSILLVAQNRQKTIVAARGVVRNDSALFLIRKDQLNEGINVLTLFNGAGQPLCERLYFLHPLQAMHIEAGSDAPSYHAREKIALTVAAKDNAGKLLPASMSLSVYLLDQLQQHDPTDIVNYLWLGSELKGRIEQADYYFSHADAAAEENLVLTQGWRKFKAPDGTNGGKVAFAYSPEHYGHIITGKVVNAATGKPEKDVQAFLSVPGIHPKFYTQKSDDSGRVSFDVKDQYGPGEIVVQTSAPDNAAYRVEVSSPYAEEFLNLPLPAWQPGQQYAPLLTSRSISMQVQHVYAEDSLAKFRLPDVDSLPFYGQPDHAYLLDNYTRFVTMEEVLREYIREINVRNRGGHPEMILLDEQHKEFFNGNLLILVDGVPVFDQSKIFQYDPLKVKKLEVVTTQYYSGYYAFNGIASFTTYKGELDGFQLDPRAVVIDYEGLQIQREFYSPAYTNEAQRADRTPDFRTVLQWMPGISTGSSRKQVSFYASDMKGKYEVALQGIDEEGRVASTSFVIEVK